MVGAYFFQNDTSRLNYSITVILNLASYNMFLDKQASKHENQIKGMSCCNWHFKFGAYLILDHEFNK